MGFGSCYWLIRSALLVCIVIIIVGLNRLHLVTVVACPITLHSDLLHRGYSQHIEGK